LIYQKQIRLSAATNKKFNQGKVINLIETDASKLGEFCWRLADSIRIPFVLIYSFTFLFMILGLSFFSGIFVFLVASYVNFKLGLSLKSINNDRMKGKDQRMNHTNEALGNIKTIKFYSQQTSFENEI